MVYAGSNLLRSCVLPGIYIFICVCICICLALTTVAVVVTMMRSLLVDNSICFFAVLFDFPLSLFDFVHSGVMFHFLLFE